ncbi:MAG: AAA family ATPase, partial [Lachnospiraceae bacterium]|nr:AAA family ATPase [Lachnospiraceae bacterium]
MSAMMRKLPIGIQDFEKLRLDNYIYVDKTRYIYNLVHMGKPYFLSRPRRFGKSLLLSTIRAYWEGKKELFKGLDIEELEKDNPDAWQEYPVFYFDFNRDGFSENDALEKILEEHLAEWEKRYELNQKQLPQPERFRHIIKTAYERTGKRVVILVDEYDKPLLEVITDNDLEEHNKSVFKGFFSTLKSYDRYIEFEFLTGVTKFSKVSIFSDLNHLRDISLSEEYADICGITETELKNAFMPEVEAMAAKQKMSLEECYEKLEKTYDGYHFNKESNGVYNPFSLINALQAKEFDSYWFSTGT